MLTMRLQRVGRRNAPMFRVVVTESRNAADGGKHLEVLGSYNPHADTNQLNAERVQYWLSQGVQPSDTVHNLLVNEKVVEGKKRNVLPKKQPIVKEADESEEAASAEPKAETKAETVEEGASEEASEAPAAEEAQETGGEEPKEESEEKTPDETPAQDDTSSEEGEEKKEV